MNKKKTYILQVEGDDPEKELEFEVAFHLNLTVKQRYSRMIKLFKQTMAFVKKHDYPKTPTIISRT